LSAAKDLVKPRYTALPSAFSVNQRFIPENLRETSRALGFPQIFADCPQIAQKAFGLRAHDDFAEKIATCWNQCRLSS
jgi:hypothetical protein